MVDLPIKMVIFHSYDSLPEGIFLKVPWRSWSWVLGIGWYGMGPEFPMGTTDFRNVWSSCFVFQQKWSHPDIHLDVALDWLVVWNIGIVIVNDEHIFHLLDQSSVEIAPEVDSVLANLPMSESFEKAEALLSTQAKQDKGEGEEGWPFLKTSFLSSIFQFFWWEMWWFQEELSRETLTVSTFPVERWTTATRGNHGVKSEELEAAEVSYNVRPPFDS